MRTTQPQLTTERMRLTPVGDVHLALLVELNQDPEVMRFLLGRAATAAETAAEWERRLKTWSNPERGLGYWAGFVGEDFAGWWSASSFAGRPDRAGVGYRLHRRHWGAGLATEGARAMVAHAFSVAGVKRVVASTIAINVGSRRVLEKAGLRHVDTVHEQWDTPLPGADLGEVVYELARGDAETWVSGTI